VAEVIKVRAGWAPAITVALTLVAGASGCTPGSRSGPAEAPATNSASPRTSTRSAEKPVPGDHRLFLDWDGKERTYEVHAPPGYQPGHALPLVVVMHYRDGTPATMREMTRFDSKADTEGFLVAYPVGINGAVNALICCGGNDDVGFIRAMVEHLTTAWGADPKRVYATGISNGADMSFRMAIEAPGVFAAIAPVSGGFLGTKAGTDPAYKPSRPVSVMSFAGANDELRGRLEDGLHTWYQKLGCTAGTADWVDPTKTVSRTVAGCADGSQVISYVVSGMGHAWPGGTNAGLGDPTAQINAVDTMWPFFVAHSGSR
jgi:polyhydroxybutyrate depolymerase